METGIRKGGFKGTAENAKTQLCTRWLNGDCRFGDRCNFAHGETELRSAPGRGRGRGRGANSRTAAAGRGFGSQGSGGYEGQAMPAPSNSGRSQYMHANSSASNFGHISQASPDSHTSSFNTGGVPENVWAACGFPLVGANGWVMYRVAETGEPYYHNADRNLTQWDQPDDFVEH